MEPDKNNSSADSKAPESTEASSQDAPADALSRTPDDLANEVTESSVTQSDDTSEKKLSPVKKLFRKINVYLLIFILVLAVAGIFTLVTYFNSTKAPVEPTVESQGLTSEALKQLANTDASVGSTNQTLTIQGNAIIAGQTLMRGNLNVAGNFQSGGSITGPSITVSGAANLGETQANSLQVASNVAVQGSTTVRDLNVSGTSSFSGAMTASQITVTKLVLSGNATLQVPNHISFTGPSPNRSINNGVLGGGGSASISGSDTSGTVNINSGNNPTAGCFIQVSFNQRFTNQPHVLVTPVSAGAGQLQFYVERSQTSFSLCTNNAAPANQVFAFDYFVTN